MQEKRGHGLSEPEDFLRIGERMDGWALMVGLIGEGQEIHLGEEAGLVQWNDAVAASEQSWFVHCPTKIAALFPAAAHVYGNDSLNLTVSLRSHLAEDVQGWIQYLLAGELHQAAVLSAHIKTQGFELYVTREIAQVKRYVQERYQRQQEHRYGLLASSKAKNLAAYGVRNEYNFTRNFRAGPWYADLPETPNSCCQLKEVATEFACQGLELDLPIVCWRDDLVWSQDRWQSLQQPRSQAHDPHRLRVNSYRVFLSRGRDGVVAFVPPEPDLDASDQALLTAGMPIF